MNQPTRIVLGIICLASMLAAEASDLSAIEDVVQDFVDRGEIPGAFVSITQHRREIFTTSIGYSDIEQQKEIGPDTIFRLYSMTKPITCAAVMKLYEEGLVELEDSVADYLPEFSETRVLGDDGSKTSSAPMTVRHLMTHTSGLGYAVLPSPVSDLYAKNDLFAISSRLTESLASHVERLAKMPLQSEPGTVWNYGESMAVLGRLVEVVSGVPFRTYLKRKLLAPLKMHDTDFFVHAADADRLAELYGLNAGGQLVNRTGEASYGGDYRRKPLLEYGGAGLVGTPRDYGRFGEMLLNLGTLDGTQVLRPDSVRMMTSRQLTEEFVGDRLETVGRPFPSGFGFCGMSGSEVNDDGTEIGTFYGWGGWAGTKFWIDRDNDLQVLVFTQTIPNEIGGANLELPIRDVLRKWLSEDASNPRNTALE